MKFRAEVIHNNTETEVELFIPPEEVPFDTIRFERDKIKIADIELAYQKRCGSTACRASAVSRVNDALSPDAQTEIDVSCPLDSCHLRPGAVRL